MQYVSYIRVSTNKQSRSGLGLDSQKDMIDKFIKKDDKIIAEYVEVESGKRKDRPKLLEAIEIVKQHNAKLLIAKIDRLARNVAFISSLMDSNIEFVAVDLPEANRFTIHLLSALAEQEARLISERTIAALKQVKKKGTRLGKPENLTNEAIEKGRRTMQENAFNDRNNQQAGNLIVLLRKENTSYKRIAEYLNANNYRTRRDGQFSSGQVQKLYKRYKDHFVINR
jgi:DNA invertase Pin-like site-specific DNA recombinase